MSTFRRLRAMMNRRRILGVGGCDEELRVGSYLLCTQLVPADARHGRIGRLYHDGVEMVADPGYSVAVPGDDGPVRFTYLGEERPFLWSVSGWTAEAVDTDA